MGKQKLESAEVALIKHLLHTENWSTKAVYEFIPIIGQKEIARIKAGKRWVDVRVPDPALGRELFYKYLRTNTLRYD